VGIGELPLQRERFQTFVALHLRCQILELNSMVSRIAFLHTSPVHVPTFTLLLSSLRADAQATHVVDESLLNLARSLGADHPDVVAQVQSAVRRAAQSGASVVVCTCSTVGHAAESTQCDGQFVAMRIDRAMADLAVNSGIKVLIVAALESTLEPTRALLANSAVHLGRSCSIETRLVPHAWTLFESGQIDAYLQSICDAVRRALPWPDVVVLAQASMAPAAELLHDSGVPVLASPEWGVRAALAAADLAD
jgi:hypothetical protein